MNYLAPQSELFVFSDGAKQGDEEKVQAVRDFLKTVNGFKRVEVMARASNSRTYNNRQGIYSLLDQFGKIIYLEEDVQTAVAFLDYMNQALDVYHDNKKIFSIAGYCPPIDVPKNYPYDVFVHPRFNPWGFGIWKDRLDQIKMHIPGRVMVEIFMNPVNLYKFSRGGLDLLPKALSDYVGNEDSLDVKIMVQQFALGMYTVYPVMHMTDNFGIDGSGMHTMKKPWFKVEINDEAARKYSMPDDLDPDPIIINAFYKFRLRGDWNRFKQRFGRY